MVLILFKFFFTVKCYLVQFRKVSSFCRNTKQIPTTEFYEIKFDEYLVNELVLIYLA